MAKMKKIRKWDEVTGNAVEEQIPEFIDPIEEVGTGPSISRNHMRGIEDMVEQNDNSFDGIINNVPAAPVPDFAEINEKADQEDIIADTKASVMEKIKEQQEKSEAGSNIGTGEEDSCDLSLQGDLVMNNRTEQFHFFATPEEAKMIRDREKEIGILNESAYLRKMAIDGYLIQMDLSDVKEAVRLLGITSSNMNQYAKKANETGSIYKEDIDDIRLHQEELWKVMKEILKCLSTI